MENDIKNSLTTYFGTYGLIFYNKLNEYYKVPFPKKENIKNLYDTLDNPQNENFPNRVNYIACCLYVLSRKDESYKMVFRQKVISSINIKKDPLDDIHLALIYNCIDFDENFLHSDPKNLLYLSKYLQKFSAYEKEESLMLLFKYYNSILNYRTGNIQDALKECLGIISNINNNNSDRIINFIKLKTQIFLAKIYEENVNSEGMGTLQENSNLLKDIYLRVINENPFLALKIGFYIFNNSYNRNQFTECRDILEQMLNILKEYEKQGVPPKKMSRFYLSIFSRYGVIGLLFGNRNTVNMAIEGMKMQLLLIQDSISTNIKAKQIFISYNFSMNLLKFNSGMYVEKPKDIGEIFFKQFSPDPNSSTKEYNYCINRSIKEQSIINYNSMISSMNVKIKEKAYKLVEDYLSKINNPNQNLISNDTILIFIIGIYDRIRNIIEQYLTDNNDKNVAEYKNQIISNCEIFWNFVNDNLERLPILRSEFIKNIIIKIFSTCGHIYIINKDYNKMNQFINYFEQLSNRLNINENTPSYELVFKVKGDLYFYLGDYNNSISFYSRSVQLMNNKNPKKAILYFNLGVPYYYINDKNKAVENLLKASVSFKNSDEDKYSFEFHKRNNLPLKKFKITNNLINKIQNSN